MTENEIIDEISFFDYFASAIISNAFVWSWNIFLTKVPVFTYLNPDIITILSYIIYIIGGTTGAYLLILKTRKEYSKSGLKSALVAWLISIPLLSSYSVKFYLNLSISVLFCFLIGGIIAALLNLKKLN